MSDAATYVRTCYAEGCREAIAEDQLMCLAHWSLLSSDLRELIADLWLRDKNRGAPSAEYKEACRLARLLVQRQETQGSRGLPA